jgi:hypothetical protein
MADRRYPVRRSRGLIGPALGGVVLIAVVVAGVAFRRELWRSARWAGSTASRWLTQWAPCSSPPDAGDRGIRGPGAHHQLDRACPRPVARLDLRFGRGDRPLAAVLERSGIPSLNDLSGLKIPKLNPGAIALSGALVIAVTGAVFWFLEAREEWLAYRRQHHVDED